MRPERSLSASEISEVSLRQPLLTYKQFFFARRLHSIASSYDLLDSGLVKKWSVLQWQGAQEVCHPHLDTDRSCSNNNGHKMCQRKSSLFWVNPANMRSLCSHVRFVDIRLPSSNKDNSVVINLGSYQALHERCPVRTGRLQQQRRSEEELESCSHRPVLHLGRILADELN